jgi:hypothetical protein
LARTRSTRDPHGLRFGREVFENWIGENRFGGSGFHGSRLGKNGCQSGFHGSELGENGLGKNGLRGSRFHGRRFHDSGFCGSGSGKNRFHGRRFHGSFDVHLLGLHREIHVTAELGLVSPATADLNAGATFTTGHRSAVGQGDSSVTAVPADHHRTGRRTVVESARQQSRLDVPGIESATEGRPAGGHIGDPGG